MTDQSETQEAARLIGFARRLVAGSLNDSLPEARRYAARLIANALSIVARELSAGTAPLEEEAARLKALFQETPDSAHGGRPAEQPAQIIERLRRRLAAEIRGGLRDADPATHALLHESLDARLRLVNPKALDDDKPPQ